MPFAIKETSRYQGNPTKLFLFKGSDPTLESLMRSVTIIPGATEFGYGTTKVSDPATSAFHIANWNEVPLIADAVYGVELDALNGPSGSPTVGKTVLIEGVFHVYAYDHNAEQAWVRSQFLSLAWTPWVTTTYDSSVQAPVSLGDPKNFYAGQTVTDFEASLDDLMTVAPHLKHVTLVAAWHGTDLRADFCQIRPMVETSTGTTSPYNWQVGNIGRSGAQVVSQVDGSPAYGGAPSDRSLYEAIVAIKARGLKVTLYPFIMMDIPAGNDLNSPYGGFTQPVYPWRGRITCTPAPGLVGTADGQATAEVQINAFFGSAEVDEFGWNATDLHVTFTGDPIWKFRRFILHMATIAQVAGVDDFLLCGELVGLTRIRDNTGAYPTVQKLKTLAADVRDVLGESVRISYAADWSEFHSHQAGGNLRFNMDPLWSDPNIDFVGIDNYFPVADWREGFSHADWMAGYTSIHDPFYIKANIEAGEYYDWFYASEGDRTNQVRTPITDGAHNEPWVYRQKDLRGWWSNHHHERIGGVRASSPTAWVPSSKPIVFTEFGCAAIDKGANQPNVFLDAKSVESAVPHFSNGRPDAAIQRVVIEATLDYWRPDGPNNEGMIEYDRISLWTWDARPHPVFPVESELFGDAANWATGHWLIGRIVAGRAFEHGTFGPYAFTNSETEILRAGITYQPWPIEHSDITTTGNLDKADITVTMATGSGLEDEFIGYPPSQVINLTIFQGHMDDAPTLVDYPAQWLGRVTSPDFTKNEVAFTCIPVSSSIQRPGLRRNYQLGCPHVLYGSACQANKKNATVSRTAASILRNRVTLTAAVGGGGVVPADYGGGLLEWTSTNGRREIRTIAKITPDGLNITVRGTLRGLVAGGSVDVVLGCSRTMTACNGLHSNILNFGGQPFIPLENPLSQKNQFY